MSEKKWDKKFRFDMKDKEFITKSLNERDKNLYETEAHYALEGFRILKRNILKPIESVTAEQKEYYEELKKVCPFGKLKIIRGLPTCMQGVSKDIDKVAHFVYGKEHPNRGDQMVYDDIKEFCDAHFNEWTEEQRAKDLINALTRKEIMLYECINPNSTSVEKTTYKTSKFVCPAQAGKQVRIDMTCIKTKCEYLIKNLLPLAPREEDN